MYKKPVRDGKKLHRPSNRYEIEGKTPRLSSSAKKLQSDNDFETNTNLTISYRILNFFSVFNVKLHFVQKCGGNITFEERSTCGLGFKLVVKCEKCNPVFIDSCPLIDNEYEVNKRFIFAMKLLGVGLCGAEKFCAFMDLSRPIFQSFYDRVVQNIRTAAKAVCDLSLSRAANAEIIATQQESEDIQGITVSRDSSWKKRGFQSLYGLSSLIGFHTGKSLDVIMKNSFCKVCADMAAFRGTAKYDNWFTTHSKTCKINHKGSSGKIEVDGIKEMFMRSESLHQVKYINYIGDSKTYKSIIDAKPYDTPIIKKNI